MNVVILVPRREDGGHRDALWAWCRARWEAEYPWPVFEGHHRDGLFNRSAALNLASSLAGEWDVAVIIDADVWANPDAVREAVRLAAEAPRMVLPYTIRKDVNEPGTALVMGGAEGSWDRFVRRTYRRLVSSVVVVSRSLWDTVGGFDETFRGWGGEDDAFAISCEAFGGIARLPGDVWHFWHPSAPNGKGSPSHTANYARVSRYHAASGNRDAIRALRAEAIPEQPLVGIPRILHRTVPERTEPQAEEWWGGFETLHPGWRLMTHRDPLDPADWPLTAPHWSKAANGAQFADLIRLEALLRWGGVYVDQDVQPFRSFEPLLPLSAFAAWENERCVPNAVMGAVPNHPAVRACLDMMLLRLPGPTWKAGPGVLTDVLPGRDDVLLLPPGSFYAVDYRDADRAAKMRDFKPKLHPWAFVLHWYAGSWLEKEGVA
jgi:hypothetical protein